MGGEIRLLFIYKIFSYKNIFHLNLIFLKINIGQAMAMLVDVHAVAVPRGLCLLLVTSAQDTGAGAGDHPVPAVPVSAASLPHLCRGD